MKKTADIEEKLAYERRLLEGGARYIVGVDEVGRGPLAGPVVCAAVAMPFDKDSLICGVDDSKKLSAKKREELAALIKERAIAYAVAEISCEKIDEINILQATRLGMREAVLRLEKLLKKGRKRNGRRRVDGRKHDDRYSFCAGERYPRGRAFLFDRRGEHYCESIQGRVDGRMGEDVPLLRV